MLGWPTREELLCAAGYGKSHCLAYGRFGFVCMAHQEELSFERNLCFPFHITFPHTPAQRFFILLLNKILNGSLDRQHWKQVENLGLLGSWNASSRKADFVVAKDGSGNYKTINEAVAALAQRGHRRPYRVVIYVKSGVYVENVEIDRDMKNVMFVGDGIDRTIVTGSQNVPDGSTTFRSATFGVSGDGFWARDMTFENTAGPEKQQAVALRVGSDLSVFYRCSFKGYQDTLLLHSQRQFYRDCHVYGTIDFIFGNAAAVLQNCDIYVRRPMGHQANMITAQGRSDPNENTGISVHESRIRPAPDFQGVKGSFETYLGRPWQKFSRTVFMKSDLDGLINPKGWAQWSGNFGLDTLYFGEYMNTGTGASTSRRVKWHGFHVLKDPQDTAPFTVSRFIQGESWIPATGVPFGPGL
ncbi:probable pectinesterase/pectinesterase inhibitor 36 isoform X2 [Magnolia sinica]|uniref:probable pectinesterase/pectinesterase inhibitor 36 isoform X2 n=1 Tax=Magnolia sinica TaxID=86752 RepID=UPI002659B963|nr:probable pectinesterase/pectinesterase inhibitor 36 isoform X2 [Magnolia sinica]